MNTRTNEADLATASRVSDTPLDQATIEINENSGEANRPPTEMLHYAKEPKCGFFGRE